MTRLYDSDLAAIALTSRLIPCSAEPFSPSEFWRLHRLHEPSSLLGLNAAEIAHEINVRIDMAERIAALLERATGMAIAIETLDHSGTWTITAVGGDFPKRLRASLRDETPVVLHGIGDRALLAMDCVGVVGDMEQTPDTERIATQLAEWTAGSGRAVVSSVEDGAGRLAMNAAFKLGGCVLGISNTSLDRVVSRPRMRKGVMSGLICLLTTSSHSMVTSKRHPETKGLIYALSRYTVALRCEDELGSTWTSAQNAIERGYGRVATWVGVGSGPRNKDLADAGAVAFTDFAHLADLLTEPSSTSQAAPRPEDPTSQLSLELDID